MIFGQTEGGGVDFEAARQAISARIGEPKSRKELGEAKTHQAWLSHFVNGDNAELVFDRMQKELTPEKFEVFKRNYINRPLSVCSRIITHLTKIYSAKGQRMDYDFGQDLQAEDTFRAHLKQIYSGVEDFEYWKREGHNLVFTEPNTIFLSGILEQKPIIKKISLEEQVDIDADLSGIRYLIISRKRDEKDHYYAWDAKYWYRLVAVEGAEQGQEYQFVEPPFPHGAKQCPAVFVGSEPLIAGKYIVRKSPLSNSLLSQDLFKLAANGTSFDRFEAGAAYPTTIRPESLYEKTVRMQAETKDKSTVNAPVLPGKFDHDAPLLMSQAPQQPISSAPTVKNEGLMGRTYVIPFEQVAAGTIAKAYVDSIVNIPTDVEALRRNAESLEALENKILAQVLGSGYVLRHQKTNANESDVSAGFDDQETILLAFRDAIQRTWQQSVTMCGQMFSKNFVQVTINLGDQYFLITRDELITYIEKVSKLYNDGAVSVKAILDHYVYQLFVIDHKGDESAIQKFKWTNVLTAIFGEDATTFLPVFEIIKGDIGTYAMGADNKTKISYLIKDFKNIITEYGKERQEQQRIAAAEQQQGIGAGAGQQLTA